MPGFTIQIKPKRMEFDPLARGVKALLLEAGVKLKEAQVMTERLYRISGEFTLKDIEKITDTLLVDPVVEMAHVEEPSTGKKIKAKKSTAGFVLDVWPKAGVTDPVGETVEKGLHDLGFLGTIVASSGQRTRFPKMKDADLLMKLAKQNLANELIHDIHLRKPD